ncbi:MAG: hypothetical protein NTV79_09845, partial [Candidatus Aureabacteria bacterium]|nr:hypothetical protein [Candidatus Auribacterota bacterium]
TERHCPARQAADPTCVRQGEREARPPARPEQVRTFVRQAARPWGLGLAAARDSAVGAGEAGGCLAWVSFKERRSW